MGNEQHHNIIGCVITADPWVNPKILLAKRKSESEGEQYWPNRWCYITEHKKTGETDVQTLARGLKEELDISPLAVIKGPVVVESRDPIYGELFRVKLYQCLVTDLADRLEITPRLSEELSRWIWTSSIPPFWRDAAMWSDQIFEDLGIHLQALFNSGNYIDPPIKFC